MQTLRSPAMHGRKRLEREERNDFCRRRPGAGSGLRAANWRPGDCRRAAGCRRGRVRGRSGAIFTGPTFACVAPADCWCAWERRRAGISPTFSESPTSSLGKIHPPRTPALEVRATSHRSRLGAQRPHCRDGRRRRRAGTRAQRPARRRDGAADSGALRRRSLPDLHRQLRRTAASARLSAGGHPRAAARDAGCRDCCCGSAGTAARRWSIRCAARERWSSRERCWRGDCRPVSRRPLPSCTGRGFGRAYGRRSWRRRRGRALTVSTAYSWRRPGCRRAVAVAARQCRAGGGAALIFELRRRSLAALTAPDGPGLLLCNPPYGGRLAAGEDLRPFFRPVRRILPTVFRRLAGRFPCSRRKGLPEPPVCLSSRGLSHNGGIPVGLYRTGMPPLKERQVFIR